MNCSTFSSLFIMVCVQLARFLFVSRLSVVSPAVCGNSNVIVRQTINKLII